MVTGGSNLITNFYAFHTYGKGFPWQYTKSVKSLESKSISIETGTKMIIQKRSSLSEIKGWTQPFIMSVKRPRTHGIGTSTENNFSIKQR